MAKNKMHNLRDHLFAQLERLNDETLSPEQMELEVKKAKAVSDVSKVLVDTVKAEVMMLDSGEVGTGFIEQETAKMKRLA